MLHFSLVRLVNAGIPPGHFTHIFVDEAGQAVEPECMIAVGGTSVLSICLSSIEFQYICFCEGIAKKKKTTKNKAMSPGRVDKVPENIQEVVEG